MRFFAPTTHGSGRSLDVRPATERSAVWLIGFVVVIYLALSGGGYDTIIRSEVGLVVWWFILVGALTGLIPRAPPSRAAGVAAAFLGAFFVWTWIGVTWSHSAEHTLLEAARISTYVGAFVLASALVTRKTARTLLNGVASAIGLIAGLAVLYRIEPSLFPADTGARFYEVSQLQWPFEYSDAVGEFVALGLPLLVGVAVAGRTTAGQMAAAAGFVLSVVCLVMTTSQGGLFAAVVGVLAVALLAPQRPWVRRRALPLLAAAFVIALVVALISGEAHHLWLHFKNPTIGGQLSLSGGHRYQYWQAAVHALASSPFHGIGPGTFQFYWAQHNSLHEFVLNAHSLYFETLAEAGIVGLVIIVGFFATTLIAGSIRALLSSGKERVTIAAAVAGLAAFCAAAGYDWVWQIGAVPVPAMLIAAVAFAKPADTETSRRPTRAILALAAIPALYAILVPLATTVAVRKSEAAAKTGNATAALNDASSAHRLEPGAAAPYIQRALLDEQTHQLIPASNALSTAQTKEPTDWRISLIASRIATEAGQLAQAQADFDRARSLNPTSPLFTKTAYLTPIATTPLRQLLVPPRKAGANQYFETIPGPAGIQAPPAAGPAPVDHAPAGNPARLAAATARALRMDGQPKKAPGDTPALTIASVLLGDDAGGIGVALPILLIGTALAAAARAAATRRKSTARSTTARPGR